MSSPILTAFVDLAQQQEPTSVDTVNLRTWILDNVVPLLLLVVALLLLYLGGGRGDNAGVMRRLGGVVIALAVIGLAVTNAGEGIGRWLAGLFTG
ncbi:hypothetical protein [Actinokineospora pegani]|uniref:hypothetical protein n=1 Tax=Actinokineospora pegani TaxID=2654637 RepID=UPI001F1FEDBA|nr:hypothetical protein [Actinokineospora pegani]